MLNSLLSVLNHHTQNRVRLSSTQNHLSYLTRCVSDTLSYITHPDDAKQFLGV